MRDSGDEEIEGILGVSRRDFLKLGSLMVGGLAVPRAFVRTIERAVPAQDSSSFTQPPYFQWQNEFLRKTIYPNREVKLRDFLIYYMEVDVWSKYKDKDVRTLTNELYAYKKDWEINAVAAQEEYTMMRDYFLKEDVRADYANFQPIDEEELKQINILHGLFADWPKDIRGERDFVGGIIVYWT
jgi:hypothetical protein